MHRQRSYEHYLHDEDENDAWNDYRQADDNQEDDSTSRRHYVNLKPDKFDGTDDFETYIESFNLVADLGRWSAREKALTLAACLRGQARRFYMGLTNYEKAHYEDLVFQLKQRFGNASKHNIFWSTQFEQRSRSSGESVAAFADELIILASKAYPYLDQRSQQSLALQQFYKSMPVDIKWRCIERDCRTLREAEEVAETFELIVGKEKKIRQVKFEQPVVTERISSPQHNRMQKEESPVPSRDASLAQTRGFHNNYRQSYSPSREASSTESRSSYDSRQHRPQHKGCYCCKETGHFFRECPVYQRCREMEEGSRMASPARNRSPSPGFHDRSPKKEN